MGKNVRHQESANVPLQNGNGNSGCVNKLLHALNRRHRWQNVRKVLPNKRQGTGKHIIDGGTSEPTENTSQPPQVPKDTKKNKQQDKQQNEQAPSTTDQSSSNLSKASKKFRIRSLISDEVTKRKGKHQRRRSSSPTRSPNKQNSPNRSRHGPEINDKPPYQSGCGSPSTVKKRKCDICAAMLTVSYLRQRGLLNELRKQSFKNIQQSGPQSSDGYLHSHQTGLKKSFSYPLLLGTTKRRDFEVEELKRKLRECKDIETIKEKFILPMDQKDSILPKPMLTRPASFKSPSTSSRKEKKQPPNNSKTLKQKLGFVVKDSRKEKKRILMDAVFHKIPYGRRSSKDGKKLEPEKLKSSSTNSSVNDNKPAGDKARLIRRVSSTTEAMNKYRKLLSQTSTRDDRCHHNDHKPRLCVVVDNTFSANDRKTLKRIRSLPNISPSDFKQNQEFPVKKMHMDINPSIANVLLDDQKSLDQFPFAEKRNVSTPSKESVAKENNLVDKYAAAANEALAVAKTSSNHHEKLDHQNNSNHQEKINHQNKFIAANEPAAKEPELVDKDEAIVTNLGAGLDTSNQPETNESEDSSAAVATETTSKETELVETVDDQEKVLDEAVDNAMDHQEKVLEPNVKESSPAIETEFKEDTESADKDQVVDEGPGGDINISDHQENDDDKEPRATTESPPKETSDDQKDKSFNEILGMFKKVSDEKLKVNQEKEPSVVIVRKKAKDKTVDNNQEAAQSTSDHQEKEKSPLASNSEVECSIQEPIPDSSSLTNIPNSPLEDLSDENQHHLLSIHDKPSIDDKQLNNNQLKNLISETNDRRKEKEFLHLDLESVKNNAEFQYVKEVLKRSGFLENEHLGDWYSSNQPINPLLFEEVETNFLQTKNLEETVQKSINDQHLLLFDLINEALLEIHNRTFMYCPQPLTICSKVRPTPVGCRFLEEVWDFVNMYLSLKPELQPSLDDIVSRDLAKGDGWMNLQADAEFVAIELEEMLADDLLDELVFDDLLM